MNVKLIEPSVMNYLIAFTGAEATSNNCNSQDKNPGEIKKALDWFERQKNLEGLKDLFCEDCA